MNKTVGIIMICVLVAGQAYAGEKGHKQEKKSHAYNKPVVVEAINFDAVYRDGTVETHWKKYLRDDFKFYKVVKSKTNPNPVYPEDGYIYYSSNAGKTSFTDRKLSTGTWHYRVCVVTNRGDRWVSPVKRIEIKPAARSVPNAKDFE